MKKCCQFYDTISQNKFRLIHVTTLLTKRIYAKAWYLISSRKCLIWGNTRNLKYKVCHLVLEFKNSHKITFTVTECNMKLWGEFKYTNSCQFYAADSKYSKWHPYRKKCLSSVDIISVLKSNSNLGKQFLFYIFNYSEFVIPQQIISTLEMSCTSLA